MMDEPAGAFAYAERACCASESLAERIEATDGRLGSGSLEAADDVELLADEAELDVFVPDVWLDVGAPGVPSSCAAWPSTASAFERPASGERNDA
jgi:hypothetical protein